MRGMCVVTTWLVIGASFLGKLPMAAAQPPPTPEARARRGFPDAMAYVPDSRPPATPQARERARLRIRSRNKLVGPLYSHNDVLEAAAVDARVIMPQFTEVGMKYIRYLDLHNFPPSEREKCWAVVSLILNSFNKRQTIVRPAWGGPNNALIRVNLFDYQIDPAAWNTLGKQDPYYHQFILAHDIITKEKWVKDWYVQSYYRDYYGALKERWAYRWKKKFVTEKVGPIKKQVQAAWLDKDFASYLGVTLGTSYPIMRADWFIKNVTLEPHYSNFLGIKNLADLKKYGGWDDRASVTDAKATIITSGSEGHCPRVARNNRILLRRSTFYGYWWETFDFLTSIGKQNVILNFLGNKRDAAEYIVSSPCGLQWYMITDANDKAIAAGDTDIVVDSMAHDATVRNGRSCIWCHKEGINEFESHFKKQVGFEPYQADLGFFDKDPKKAMALRQKTEDLFGKPNFAVVIKQDQARYNAAVKECTNGLTAADAAQYFKEIWDGYHEEPVTNLKACYELGMTEAELKMILALRYEGKNNGVLIQSLLEPPIAIRRDQWEESFHEAALLSTLRHKIPPPRAIAPVK